MRAKVEYSNKLGLPDVIVQAVKNDPYRGGGDVSVTSLLRPPYQVRLERLHGRKEDAADRIWSLIGQIGHSILERVPVTENVKREERVCRKFDVPGIGEKTVSGQFDLIENGVLTDFKFVSVWSGDGKIEWEQQLNMLAFLCNYRADLLKDDGYSVNRLQIVAIFRDWSKLKANVEPDYPKAQVAVIPVEMWSPERQHQFIVDRLVEHFAPDPPPCSDEQRWKRPEVWAVHKSGRKTATKLFPTRDEAVVWIENQRDKNEFRISHRPATFARCESYCAVSHACPVWNEVPF